MHPATDGSADDDAVRDMAGRVVGDAVVIADPSDPSVAWQFDRDFMASHWECTWGRGCLGILAEPAAHLGQGCCSVGAQLADETESMTVSASAAAIPSHLWQYRDAVDEYDVFTDATRTFTKVVDGACIFFNRPGFAGGTGCALHLAAIEFDERPLDWKPAVCWQAPIKVIERTERRSDGSPVTVVTVRPWRRADWGDGSDPLAWCCTDQSDRREFDSFTGGAAVVESLRDELVELAGEQVWAELRRRLAGDITGHT